MPRLDLYVNYELQASVQLKDPDVTVGRDPGCTIQIPDPKVSRQHAVVRTREGVQTIENFGTNGTRVNGRTLSEACELHPGDAIFIASHILVYQSDDAPVGDLPHTVLDP